MKKGINGKPTTGSDAEDISVAISKLTFGIEDVEKQLKNVVSITAYALWDLVDNILAGYDPS